MENTLLNECKREQNTPFSHYKFCFLFLFTRLKCLFSTLFTAGVTNTFNIHQHFRSDVSFFCVYPVYNQPHIGVSPNHSRSASEKAPPWVIKKNAFLDPMIKVENVWDRISRWMKYLRTHTEELLAFFVGFCPIFELTIKGSCFWRKTYK